jgi:hypothetical protein
MLRNSIKIRVLLNFEWRSWAHAIDENEMSGWRASDPPRREKHRDGSAGGFMVSSCRSGWHTERGYQIVKRDDSRKSDSKRRPGGCLVARAEFR